MPNAKEPVMLASLAWLAIALWITPGIVLLGYLLWLIYQSPSMNPELAAADASRSPHTDSPIRQGH